MNKPESFGAWIASIARSVCAEKHRSFKRDRHRFVGDQHPDSESKSSLSSQIEICEEIQLMLQEVSQLPEQERLAIHAFYLEEQNVEQAGKILNLSRSGVYALLQRAFRRLVSQLNSLETTSEEN
ncbi:MAG: sigma-70 family RNA polymerase sigma factor [Acidobacteria bacterium]|nr:sigma-70 family RNA polymerase sigma factor [Acidobacteriota bacterium]